MNYLLRDSAAGLSIDFMNRDALFGDPLANDRVDRRASAGVDVKRSLRTATGDDEVGGNQRRQSRAQRRAHCPRPIAIASSLPPGGLRFDPASLHQPASSACASAISWNSVVRAKPSIAGAGTAWASAGRAADS